MPVLNSVVLLPVGIHGLYSFLSLNSIFIDRESAAKNSQGSCSACYIDSLTW